ncbi:MAG: SDR family NAD(P)-dependent oxidoreductase [Pseudomonadota bacterium]
MIGNGPAPPEPGPLPATALIAGGAGTLGLEISKALAAERRIAIIDVGSEVEARAGEIEGAIGLRCDLADSAALEASYHAAFEALGPIGVVVHCAAIAPIVPFLDTDRATFEAAINVNLISAFETYRLAARDLVRAGMSGRFVSIASISGARAGYGRAAYGTAKAALIHLGNQMALELGPYGITANTIAPGPVDTPFSRAAHTAEARADYQRSIPMTRFGEVSDVVGAVRFLTSPDARYVSGQTLFVDGGYMAAGMGVGMAQSAAAVRRGQ